MGEARRKLTSGYKPANQRLKSDKDHASRIVPWLPITVSQREKFFSITKMGAWVGIAMLILLWIIVRVIGPAAGWWIPADIR